MLLSKVDHAPLPAPAKADENGVRNKKYKSQLRQHRWSQFFYGKNVPLPTAAELEEAKHHLEHQAALEAPLHAYEDADQIRPFHGGVLHHPGMAETNAGQDAESTH